MFVFSKMKCCASRNETKRTVTLVSQKESRKNIPYLVSPSSGAYNTAIGPYWLNGSWEE